MVLELSELKRFVTYLEDNDRIWGVLNAEMRETVSRRTLNFQTCVATKMRLRFTKRWNSRKEVNLVSEDKEL